MQHAECRREAERLPEISAKLHVKNLLFQYLFLTFAKSYDSNVAYPCLVVAFGNSREQ